MTKRPLRIILADIESNDEVANTDLDALPASVRPGHVGAVRRAKEHAKELVQEYRDTVLDNSLAFFVEGGAPGAPAQFAEIAMEEGTLSLDAGSMYSEIAEKLGSLMGFNTDFGLDHTMKLDYILRGIATTSGYGRAVDLPRNNTKYQVRGKAELTAQLRKLAETTPDGAKLNVLVTTQKLMNEAITRRLARKTFAVVIFNASQADRNVLETLFSKSVTVDLTGVETIDASFVIETFKEARKPAPAPVAPPPQPPAPSPAA